MTPQPKPSRKPDGIGGLMIRQGCEGHRSHGNMEFEDGDYDPENDSPYNQDWRRNFSQDLGGL